MAASIIDDERILPGQIIFNRILSVCFVFFSLLCIFFLIDAVPVIRQFLYLIYTKHSNAFVQVIQTFNEPLRGSITKHLQIN